MQPDFSFFSGVPITNYHTGEIYWLRRVDRIVEKNLDKQIATICNQPIIYDRLFRERREGQPYHPKDARWFIDWGRRGWERNDLFLFFTLTEDNQVAAAIDIKSAELDSPEIGYWCSQDHPGIMTNTVIALRQIMPQAGFRGVHALVSPDNDRSMRVLQRASFEHIGQIKRANKWFEKFIYQFKT